MIAPAKDSRFPAPPQHRETPDARLVVICQQGDPEAFSELVRRHHGTVYALALRFMRDPAFAEDMTQEAFLKAFRLIGRFRGDCAFTTWMYRVTCSVCLTEIERRKRRGEVAFENCHDTETSIAPPTLSEAPQLVRACVARLPQPYADAITLYYLEGLSYEIITQRLGVPEGTLKTWMHRARKQLHHMMEREIWAYER